MDGGAWWLQSMGLRGVGHDWATSLSLFTFMRWRRKWQPLQCSCLENPRDGVAQSRRQLKWLSSSSSNYKTQPSKDVGKMWGRILLIYQNKIHYHCITILCLIYIYIYRERERERDVSYITYIHLVYTHVYVIHICMCVHYIYIYIYIYIG